MSYCTRASGFHACIRRHTCGLHTVLKEFAAWPEFVIILVGLSLHHCRLIVKCSGGREISMLLKS